MENRSILLVKRPEGMPNQDNFKLITKDVPEIGDGEVLIRTIYLSVDPYMRGRMNGVKTYADPFELNEVLSGGVVGKVVESRNEKFQIGDIIEGRLSWADYAVSKGDNIRKIDPSLAPISTAVGVVGMPGLTAYFGFLDIGKPKQGETVVVSGAAGAVGSTVGQIAKIKGCYVVGIAGTAEKCKYLKEELGFDQVINYKTDNVKQKLKEHCPNGVDIYFDNVGGEISDAVIRRINYQSRIILCGQISAYNLQSIDSGPRVQGQLIQKSALMQGFIVGDFAKQHREGLKQLGQWVSEGSIKYRENVIEGLENTPDAFIGLFRGENTGKQLVKVNNE
ncbi:NADP-dependent oxidoreductase [Cytobacillus purgationiresistens]|uniref:NADPH-dependent curcumin reductase CurA n=1 Tax=Cytobacillus purgationiresistens TaxID=863449 RepID=A0ABU0AI60_9BACI|nr:NADP-dependent oxidoreductase [Cytobacillus purgationiresistens]MDQ0269765.1 NADPH-dependent curcumin reductase CurA [Cytobacillus purgationiresistens]